MRPRIAVVGIAVLALAGVAAMWLRAQSTRTDAIGPGSPASESSESPSARLDSPAGAAAGSVERSAVTPAAEHKPTPGQVVWSGVRVTGAIVDDHGAPISRAFVSLVARPPDWKAGDQEQVLAQTATPDSGRFEIEASMPNRVFSLRAGHPDHEGAESDALRPGASDVTLVLPAITGTIAGRVLLDDCVARRDLMVVLGYETPPPAATPGANVRGFLKLAQSTVADKVAPLAADGTFLIEHVREGPAQVRVCATGGVETFGRVEQVEVRRNETTSDPRLDPLDLRGILRCYELRALDAEGRPVHGGEAMVLSREQASARPAWKKFEDGELHLLTCMTCFDVELRAPSFHDEFVTCVNGPREVVMRAALEVRVEVHDLPAREPDHSILFSLTSLETSMPAATGYGTTVQHGDGATFRVGAPGRYRLAARAHSKSGAAPELDFGGQELPTIDVREVPGEQFFRVALPPATLRPATENEYR